MTCETLQWLSKIECHSEIKGVFIFIYCFGIVFLAGNDKGKELCSSQQFFHEYDFGFENRRLCLKMQFSRLNEIIN